MGPSWWDQWPYTYTREFASHFWVSRTLRGLPSMDPHSWPPPAFLSIKQLQSKNQFNQRREKIQRKGKTIQQDRIMIDYPFNKAKDPYSVFLQGREIIFWARSLELFCRCWSPTGWKKSSVCFPQAHRPLTGWNQKVDDADSQWPHHPSIRKMSMNGPCPAPQTLQDSSREFPSWHSG